MTFPLLVASMLAVGQDRSQIEIPKALDPAIVVELIASEPDLVTPVGVTVDDAGRVIVVESHTHFRPEGYEGPSADRLRQFEDKDGDGKYETISTLYEGGRATMNVQVERDGSLLVANRGSLYRLRRDAGGKVTGSETLVKLVTEGDYPHNGLSGLAVDLDGSIYLGMGENMGISYVVEGSDGTQIPGLGEGGHVFKLKPDGSGLRLFATGFWNPFELELDDFGRLFVVDNDPDSSPPCRFVFAVDGGDYGYRFRNGRRGWHPFTSWNGELPGTLPMACGTGEAPSGILQYDSPALPAALRGKMLVTSWGDHRIYEYPLLKRGAGVFSKRGNFVEGGVQFRPVGMAQAPDGSLFVSDWVDRDYNLHRKGRLWRIRPKQAAAASKLGERSIDQLDRRDRARICLQLAENEAGRLQLRAVLASHVASEISRAWALRALVAARDVSSELSVALDDPNPEVRALAVRSLPVDLERLRALARDDHFLEARAEALRRLHDPSAEPEIRAALRTGDPFLVQAAMAALGNSMSTSEISGMTRDSDAEIRLAAVLALRSKGLPQFVDVLEHTLVDPDHRVRLASVQWVAQSGLTGYRDRLMESMRIEPTTPRLATAHVVALRKLEEGKDTNDRELPYAPIAARLATDTSLPSSLRSHLLRDLRAEMPELAGARLDALLSDRDANVRSAAVRLIAARAQPGDMAILREIARGENSPIAARSEALAGLANGSTGDDERAVLLAVATQGAPALRKQAARGLRHLTLDEATRDALTQAGVLETVSATATSGPLDSAGAKAVLAKPGDAAEGERVFFHPKGPGCYRCHQISGRGSRIGPDLSTFGQNAGAERVLESILTPSKEIAPQFTSWQFVNKDGTIVVGQLIEDRGNEQVYADAEGKSGVIKLNELEARAALPTSIMPDNLAHTMTPQELRDLVEYLITERASDDAPLKAARFALEIGRRAPTIPGWIVGPSRPP